VIASNIIVECWTHRKYQRLRLALSKSPNTVYVSLPSPEDVNGSSFRNVVFSSYLEFWTMDKVQKSSDSEGSVYWSHVNYKRVSGLLCVVATEWLATQLVDPRVVLSSIG
jgi:hypothetical protein